MLNAWRLELWEFWCVRSCVIENSILGYDAASTGKWIPTFWAKTTPVTTSSRTYRYLRVLWHCFVNYWFKILWTNPPYLNVSKRGSWFVGCTIVLFSQQLLWCSEFLFFFYHFSSLTFVWIHWPVHMIWFPPSNIFLPHVWKLILTVKIKVTLIFQKM